MWAQLQQYMDTWVQRRLPAQHEVTLKQRRIFIVPSKTALTLLVLITLLFILGINFQNSLVYAVCFWLLALLVINVFYTYRNLAGLTLRAQAVEPCFAGEKAVFGIELSCPESTRKFALQCHWPDEDQAVVDLVNQHHYSLHLSHSTKQRGYFRPPRLQVSTYYPTGLVVAWSYVSFDVQGVVYPAPASQAEEQVGKHSSPLLEDGIAIAGGSQDFAGIREYREGDSPRRVHWRKLGRNGELYTREFVDYASHDLWLDWDSLAMPGIELRLSLLCRQVLDFHQQQRRYGLRLPNVTIEPDKGEAHKHRCLRALALFGVDDG